MDDGYTVADLAAMSRLSRSTIRYYISIGIIKPSDHENGKYGIGDVQRLFNAIMLKNLGIAPKDLVRLLDTDAFTHESFETYQNALDTRIAYAEAQKERLCALETLRNRTGAIWIGDVEPFLFKPTNPPKLFSGHGIAERDPMFMPVSNIAGRFIEDNGRPAVAWGRAVPARYAGMVTGFSEDLQNIGGVRCTILSHHEQTPNFAAERDWGLILARMADQTESCGERPTGPAFIPYGLLTEKEMWLCVCLPLDGQKKGGRWRTALRRAVRSEWPER